jgi:hypothetical protein
MVRNQKGRIDWRKEEVGGEEDKGNFIQTL